MSDARRRSRALALPTRSRLVDLLAASSAPLTAHDLARALDIHPTAVRQHMELLIDVGIVTKVQLEPVGRGRPPVAYRVTGEIDPHAWLTRVLAAALSEGVTAHEMGRRLGVERATDVVDVASSLVDEAERVGFRPRLRRNGATVEIMLQDCPFERAARDQPEVICELHRGLAEGLVSRRSDVASVELRVTPALRGGCRLIVRHDVTTP